MTEPSDKILDLSYLIEASDGDPEFIDEILGDYLVEMAKHLVELQDLFERRDIPTLARSAHTIKGASANVGASRVRETAAKLESQVKKGAIDGGDSLISLIKQEVERVRELVQREGVENLLKASA